jgi:hypothetical protein
VTSSKVEREGSRRSASLTAQSFLVDLIASLRLWSVSWWYAASPQEKSNRATDMPALRQAEMVSTERDLGPSVPTILVMAGKKLCPPTQVNRYGLGGCVRRRSIPPDLSSRAKKKGKKREGEGAHGLGRLQDGGHPDGLLEQQVRGMHRGARFGSDRKGERQRVHRRRGRAAAAAAILLSQGREEKLGVPGFNTAARVAAVVLILQDVSNVRGEMVLTAAVGFGSVVWSVLGWADGKLGEL